MEGNGIERVDVWRKGVDIDRFNPSFKSDAMRSELSDGNPRAPLLLYVGRLGNEKRIKDLKAVLESIPDARLALVGKVNELSRFLRRAPRYLDTLLFRFCARAPPRLS